VPRKARATHAPGKKAPEKAPSRSVAEKRDLASRIPTINVYGDFPGHVAVIPFTQMTLLMGVGRVVDEASDEETDTVLVPYVEMKLGGPEGEDGEREVLFSKVMAFENVAFILADMLNDFSRVSGQLGDVAGGKMQPDMHRLALCRRYVEAVRSAADEALDVLNKTLQH